ncbi:MAG: hypothetical protein N3F62_08085, partial [Bacteroidia bacterium]|nr:hypothetical protein [Bacteroidia bacterium]
EFYESTSKSLMPQYMSLLETQSQIYNAEQSTLNQFIQESIITNPFETPYDLYIDGIRVRSGTAGYNMLMDWAMRGRTDMLGAVTIATYGGLSTNSGVVYDMGALLDIAIENYQQEIIELQTAASKAQSKEELEETISRPYFDTGGDPPGGKKKKSSGNAKNIFIETYVHFQFGGGKPLYLSTSSLDFSDVTQKDLIYDSKTNTYSLNLYEINPMSQIALALGKISLVKTGENQYSILPDYYDFNIEWDKGFTQRNIATFGAGFIHYYGVSPIVPLIFGGPYWIIFNGTITIKP